MMSDYARDIARAKALVAPWRGALYEAAITTNSTPNGADPARAALIDIAEAATFHMCAPFGDIIGAESFYDTVFVPLKHAIPDLERRDYIVMAGYDTHGALWVGTGGYYTGLFASPWLDIPATGHQVVVRYHEFYRVVDDKVTEAQALWDIPAVMMQARAWPLAPSLGLEWHVPGPATQDGLAISGSEAEAVTTRAHIVDMLEHLKRHPANENPEAMEMTRFWHENMNWYGPGGIGTARGIAGFRHWHQIPFLNAMPDRGQYLDEITYHFFGEGAYAAVTGWPNMMQTITNAGWLGLPPTHQRMTMRSLDFWRMEAGKIRENWVLVDMLDMYAQLGVDVFARLREFNKARCMGTITMPEHGA